MLTKYIVYQLTVFTIIITSRWVLCFLRYLTVFFIFTQPIAITILINIFHIKVLTKKYNFTQLTALFFLYTTPQHNLPTNHMAQEVRISILVILVTSCVKHSCKIPLQSTNAINYFLKYYLYQI